VTSQYVPFVNEWFNVREQYANKEYMNSDYSITIPMDFAYDLLDTNPAGYPKEVIDVSVKQ
jgi:hypothetical protein